METEHATTSTRPASAAAGRGSGAPRATYHQRIAAHRSVLDGLARRSRRLSNARGAAFVVLVGAGLVVERSGSAAAIAGSVAVLLLFVGLVVAHARVRRRERWYAELVRVNEEGLHRLDRAWESLPVRWPEAELSAHPYAGDLDLYGSASLSQVLGQPGSAAGAAVLDGWLLGRSEPEAIRQRQEAVRELAPLLDLRESLAVHGRRTRAVRRRDVERFLAWAVSPPLLPGRVVLRAASFVLPAGAWTLIVLHATGVVSGPWWLVPVLLAGFVHFRAGAAIRCRFDEAFGREGVFTAWPDLLRVASSARFEAPLLRAISGRLAAGGEEANVRLARLGRLMNLADLRHSMMHLPVNLLTLWDVHVLSGLESWQEASGGHVRDWIDAVGELEALCALATLAHDEPAWAFAEVSATAPAVIEAEALGHPLIPGEERVCNDVQVGPRGTFVFVTGSNMSGKSTLLRAVGANVVLAQAGAPSCARRLAMPPLEVHTSIRVQDSLARGVSYFMAELERLKQVVDAAERVADTPGVTLLFLLDEILHGTNTAERRIAARRVIRHLVDTGGIGVATTHDLELAEEPELVPSARLVHFREDVAEGDDGSTLSFDYRLRPGLATSTNALKLMRLVGLPDA